MPYVTTDYNRIPLATLNDIRNNSYRSKDGKRDYYPQDIEDAITTKLAKKSDNATLKNLKELEQYEIEKEYLLKLTKTIKEGMISTDNHSILTPFTLTCVINDLSNVVADYK